MVSSAARSCVSSRVNRPTSRAKNISATARVEQVQFGADRVAAKVTGQRVYRVKIWRRRGEIHFSCSCPAGREHTFCKHCVAVGLTWLASAERARTDTEAAPALSRQKIPASRENAPAPAHLRSLDRDRLVSLLLEATDYDDILRRRLLMETIGVAGRSVRGPRWETARRIAPGFYRLPADPARCHRRAGLRGLRRHARLRPRGHGGNSRRWVNSCATGTPLR